MSLRFFGHSESFVSELPENLKDMLPPCWMIINYIRDIVTTVTRFRSQIVNKRYYILVLQRKYSRNGETKDFGIFVKSLFRITETSTPSCGHTDPI